MDSPNPAPPISVLMYHQVGRFAKPTQHRSSFCDLRRFRAQMGLLKTLGCRVISLREAQAALTCSRGTANTAPNRFEIPRKAIADGNDLFGFAWKLLVKNRRKDRYA